METLCSQLARLSLLDGNEDEAVIQQHDYTEQSSTGYDVNQKTAPTAPFNIPHKQANYAGKQISSQISGKKICYLPERTTRIKHKHSADGDLTPRKRRRTHHEPTSIEARESCCLSNMYRRCDIKQSRIIHKIGQDDKIHANRCSPTKTHTNNVQRQEHGDVSLDDGQTDDTETASKQQQQRQHKQHQQRQQQQRHQQQQRVHHQKEHHEQQRHHHHQQQLVHYSDRLETLTDTLTTETVTDSKPPTQPRKRDDKECDTAVKNNHHISQECVKKARTRMRLRGDRSAVITSCYIEQTLYA